jgi:hypothetical protein
MFSHPIGLHEINITMLDEAQESDSSTLYNFSYSPTILPPLRPSNFLCSQFPNTVYDESKGF